MEQKNSSGVALHKNSVLPSGGRLALCNFASRVSPIFMARWHPLEKSRQIMQFAKMPIWQSRSAADQVECGTDALDARLGSFLCKTSPDIIADGQKQRQIIFRPILHFPH